MKKLVILTGAGISAESGLKTFRDSDGLWEGYNVEEVCTADAWRRNPVLVQTFYNDRRKAIIDAWPNAAHIALARLQEKYDVQIITQNIDDLHERAGSKSVTHLHGLITRSQSSLNSAKTYPLDGWEIKMGDVGEDGSQLRPHVVFFGEAVPMLEKAIEICAQADIFAVIGTSLVVYPAAGLVDYVPKGIVKYIVDPNVPLGKGKGFIVIQEKATVGVVEMVRELMGEITLQ
ncbi:SIR2 family NAD-dependent protein deacylase [Arcticibacter svalbardensis]|nr:Sir2 family NAD-dependent protein deacetylase [Arcticibacter svalbardensis]